MRYVFWKYTLRKRGKEKAKSRLKATQSTTLPIKQLDNYQLMKHTVQQGVQKIPKQNETFRLKLYLWFLQVLCNVLHDFPWSPFT